VAVAEAYTKPEPFPFQSAITQINFFSDLIMTDCSQSKESSAKFDRAVSIYHSHNIIVPKVLGPCSERPNVASFI
jgi:hypothetical protein